MNIITVPMTTTAPREAASVIIVRVVRASGVVATPTAVSDGVVTGTDDSVAMLTNVCVGEGEEGTVTRLISGLPV